MTAAAVDRYDPAADDEHGPDAEENARRKAKVIAAYAWRLGITFDELGALPYSDKHDRKRPTLRRFAAAAYRAAGVAENVPHSRTSDTWRHLREELEALAERAEFGAGDVPAGDLLDERTRWLPDREPDEIPAEIPPPLTAAQLAAATPVARQFGDVARRVADRLDADERHAGPLLPPPPSRRVRPVDLLPYAEAPALVTSGARPVLPGEPAPPGRPRGWDALVALGPLDPPRPCRWCGEPAVVGTLNGWRCAEHPPVRGDVRGDWGWGLDWTPKPGRSCPATGCWCGRCDRYDVKGEPLRSLRPVG